MSPELEARLEKVIILSLFFRGFPCSVENPASQSARLFIDWRSTLPLFLSAGCKPIE